jgi:hypothetical protein
VIESPSDDIELGTGGVAATAELGRATTTAIASTKPTRFTTTSSRGGGDRSNGSLAL